MVVVPEADRRAWKLALSQMVKRAERQDDQGRRNTFVELADLSARMLNDENQILFGRRGTGKSHAFYHLRDAVEETGSTAILIDLRTIGSAGGYYLSATGGRSLAALHIIVDILSALHSRIYELSLALMEDRDVTDIVRAMDHLAEASSALTIDGPITRASGSTHSRGGAGNIGIGMTSRPSIHASSSWQDSEESSDSASTSGQERPALNFSQVAKAISELVPELPSQRLWLLLDEWSALPLDVQPIVADFLRRCFLPCRGLVLKIAAVERRSRFWSAEETGYVGLEMGADINAGLDLDSYLAQGLKAAQPPHEFYSTMLLRHVRATGERQGLAPEVLDAVAHDYMLRAVFPAFLDAVYFSAGVPRDLLAIAGMSASRSSPGSNIDYSDVVAASRQFFLQEKEVQARFTRSTRALSSALRDFAENDNMRFLVDRDYSHESEELLELLDQRIIHLLDRGIGPRGKFDLFAIDLGMVADVLAEEQSLPGKRNPWVNWDHVKTSQKVAPILHLKDGRIRWRDPS